jgi:general secretion pathway protein H
MNQKQKGFTLLEILIILVIFAITMGFAVLTFGDFGKSRQVRVAAEAFQQVVQYFREQAILGSTNYTIKISSAEYRVLQSKLLPNQSSDVPRQLSKTNLPSGVIVSPASTIQIYSTGNVTAFKLIFGSTAHPNLFRLIGHANGNIMIEPYE